MTAAAHAPAEPESAFTHKQILTIFSGLLLAMFLASFESTVTTTAIRTIGDDLHGLSMQAWVTTGFLITATITAPLAGKLGDLYGRKRLLLLGTGVFIVGSMLCGLAENMYVLAAFRAVQGVGSGAMIPSVQATIGDVIPPRERVRYQAYFVATYGISSVLGPVVGGFFASASSIFGIAGWRWIFFLNLPLGLLVMGVTSAALHLEHVRREQRIDWPGASMLVLGLGPLLLVSEQGRDWGWASPAAFTCYLLGAVGVLGFIVAERQAGEAAMLPLSLFRGRTFTLGSAQSLVLGAVMFGGMAVIPLYLQIVKGVTPTHSGLLILPMVVGMGGASYGAGQIISRTGRYKIAPVCGSAVLIVAGVMLVFVGANTSYLYVTICLFLFGLGMGANLSSMLVAMQNAADAKHMGVVTSAATFFRQMGGSLATAIFITVLFARAHTEIPGQLAAAGKQLPAGAAIDLNDSRSISSLPAAVRHPVLVGFANSMQTVFVISAIVSVLALVFAVLIKEVALRTVSGQQARRQAEAALAASEAPV